MPSDPNPERARFTPAEDFDQRMIPVTRQSPSVWFRVHRRSDPVVQFGRSPHHRFSHPDCPFPLLYLGATIRACLLEMFGDDVYQATRAISAAKWNGRCLSQIVIPELRACAVSLERTRASMSVDKASLLAGDLRIPQAWGLAVQKHPAGFEAIKYSSRFLDQPCLALFDRGTIRSKLRVDTLGQLPELDATVEWLSEQQVALV